MQATGFNHVSVATQDMAESVRFYRELFGLEPIPAPNFGIPVQWFQLGTSQLHIFERPADVPIYHHFGLNVVDFEAVYFEAEKRGIFDTTTFGHHLFELPNDVVQLYLRDPSGNLIEVNWPDARSLDPSIQAELKKMADRFPQSDVNLQASLYSSSASRTP